MTLSVQFITMLSMTAGGFYLGIALDTFRRLAVFWKQRVLLVYCMEIGFWLAQTLLLYYVLFRANSGELRFYVFLALLLGFSMYKALAANFYKTLLEHVIRAIAAVFRFIERLVIIFIIKPIKFILQMFLAIIIFIAKLLWEILRYSVIIVFTPAVWLYRRIFQIFPETIQKKLHKVAGIYSTIKNKCKKWLNDRKAKRR
ncbi:spore cortex biosynthesis protein YabQ [Lentibacillus persicus]|uniref:Spore cortex biosynthesis protein YabQ n=1 Tax=Lentibacillus persicus TaxID=640948 RepID=A0A1I1URF4_9BACI|nr:spore cortex biosynthesis protein YabQ [Lentibacillus persicus]SFD73284.1 spore cortex biosynthesis protein YabQ [Lentibacillus persicus]